MKMKMLLLTIAVVVFMGSCASDEKARPNILICVADDVSFPHVGYAGCDWARTPNWDQIAAKGLMFAQAYTPNAKCAPSRATLLTGRYSWQLEEAGNHWCYFPAKYKTYAEALGEHGYWVGYTGKGWAPGDPGKIDGKKRQLLGKTFSQFKLDPPTKEISDVDYAANFNEFIENRPDGQPFCFWYGSNEPHRAYEFQTGVNVGGFKLDEVDKVPDFWPDVDSVRHVLLDYAFELEHFDNHLGAILKNLEERGELSNTIVIVTADNGMPFPRVKGQCYEYSNHLPLAIMWADGIKKPGRIIDDFVSFVDIAPTILELAGVSQAESGMQSMPGKSLTQYFNTAKEGKVDKTRDHVLICKERHDIGRPHDWGYPIRGIVNDTFLYIVNYEPTRWPAGNPETGYLNADGSPTKSYLINGRTIPDRRQYWLMNLGLRPSQELYNVAIDPFCVNNLAKEDMYAGVIKSLRSQMEKELAENEDPRMEGKGNVFDAYPLASEMYRNYYDKYLKGENPMPGWINKSDFDPAAANEKPVE